MLRRFRIKTRLLISFSIVVFFTLIVGVIGFASLTSIGDSAVKMVNNVRILNDVFDDCVAVDAGITTMLYVTDIAFGHYVVEKTKEHTATMVAQMDRYLAIQEQFQDVFTPGEMQEISTIFEVYKEVYIPIAYEVFDLVEHGHREEALSIAINRLAPTYASIMYTINAAFLKNLEYSEILTAKNSGNASLNAFLMLAVGLLALIVSIILALAVTKSIAIPLSGLEKSAERVARGELDVQFEDLHSNDEISHLSLRLRETLHRLAQVQHLRLEAIKAQHEKEKAETLARTKGDFLAKMSHEIRTPMNAITGMAELALREDMPVTAREHVLTIKQAGGNLLSIINDILDFSKIESGKLEIVPVNYLFASLINDVISIIRTRVVDSNLLLVVNADCNIPNALYGDEVRVRQTFLNILSNAVKYTQKGFVSLTVTGEVTGDTVNLTIAVKDSGRGIKKEDLKNLFGNFAQFDQASNKGIEGTGLGLAITRSIVRAMDGDILVDSEYGKGSTFTVKLPQKVHKTDKMAFVENPQDKSVLLYERREIYAQSILNTLNNLGVDCTAVSDDNDFNKKIKKRAWPYIFVSVDLFENVSKILAQFEQQSDLRQTQIVILAKFGEVITGKDVSILTMPAYSISIANMLNGVTTGSVFDEDKKLAIRFIAPNARVLVVDDINTNLKVAEGLLLPYKMQVELCTSGFKAIEMIKANHYDLVFMDHMMPEMNGVEATAAIRALDGEYFKNLPIVALTANAVSGMREMFIENSFNDFIAKPIDISKLDEILDRWIPKDKREIRKREKEDAENSAPHSDSETPPFPDPHSLVIPGVDVQRGIALTGGTMEFYFKVLELFRKDAQERLLMLQAVPSAAELPAFIIHVHALKGASSSIGAAEVSALAAKLEAAGKVGEMSFIQENIFDFAELLAELVRNINAVLDPPAAETPETGSKPANAVSATSLPPALLKELEAALESQKVIDIYRLLDELKQGSDAQTKEILQEIYDYAMMSEFESAIKTVKERFL